ncbi:MAG: DinB family protein [Alphaproteobacteria bacterium]|nr:DinB family protein [Alphaproteobacteria bacterium]MCY4320014.1 DinB family protein [Alphaproteobacteria bacterium]
MFLDHFKTMAAYNRWANGRLYDACAGLSDAERKRNRAAFFGSIHNTLNHILVGDRVWLGRIEGLDDSGTPLDAILFDDFNQLRHARDGEDARIDRVLAAMTEDQLAGDLAYSNLAGTPFRTPMRLVWTHMFNHETHHRGQVHDMLSQAELPPPELDLIYYVRSL